MPGKIKINHNNIYIFGLILLVVSLPLSLFMLSVSQAILLGNWLIEGKFKTKWKRLIENKSIIIFCSLYLVHILGLFNTSDFNYAFHDLKIKLPIIIMALVIGTSDILTKQHFKIVILFFIGGVIISSLISFMILLTARGNQITDIRDISIFISHIRFSLLINLAIFSAFYFLYMDCPTLKKTEKYFYFFSIIWLTIFLFILQSLTGVIIFALISLSLIVFFTLKSGQRILKISFFSMLFFIAAAISFYIIHSINRYYNIEHIDFENLELYTDKGNPYYHDTTNRQIENGHFVWIYINEFEMIEKWNTISNIDYHGQDLKGHEIKHTIIRYLTSKGLRKDAQGISNLSENDIKNIESGVANHIFTQKFNLYPRIYTLIWEIDNYLKGNNPSGHSFTQRIEYIRIAGYIIKENFWFGVGTGDVQQSFNEMYERTESQLGSEWRRRAHNQYITFFLTFGVFGFIWIMSALIYPLIFRQTWRDYFVLIFIAISFLSMINEDTLETHTGASMIAFFYALFLWGKPFYGLKIKN